MITLAFNTAISNKFTSGVTFLQFDVIDFCDAAGSTTNHVVCHPPVCAHYEKICRRAPKIMIILFVYSCSQNYVGLSF